MVVEPETARFVIVVVANVEVPTTVNVPVKLAALEIVWPLISPEAMVPMLVKLPEESIL